MLRRKLFAYTIAFITGIIIGFYFFECSKTFFAVFLMIFIYAFIRNVDFEVGEDSILRERNCIYACVIFGIILFIFSYISMNIPLKTEEGKSCSIADVNSITGRVESIKTKNDSYKIIIDNTSIKGSKKIEVSYYDEIDYENDIYELLGARICIFGKLKKPTEQENPCCFNYKLYQYSKGIRFNFSAKSIVVENYSNNLFWKYKRLVSRCRENFLSQFNYNPEIRAFIKGVIFGDKSEINEETIEEFNDNSTGHILAVSGLHIGFLFALLRFITKKSRSKASTIIIIFVLIIYGEMTSWSPSTIRATLVLGINLMAIYARRTPDLLSSISASAFVILICNPYMLFNSGFQMSFMALLGLVFFANPLEYFVGKYFAPLFAIQLSITPLVAYLFNRVNLISILINIPIVYLASIIVPLSIVSICVMIVFGVLPETLSFAIEIISKFIIRINSFLNFDGMFNFNVKSVNLGILVAFYLIAFFVASEWFRIKTLRKDRKSIYKMSKCIIILALIVCIGTFNGFANDEIVFVSVGQGDCMHIRCGSNDLVIDGGGSKDFNVAKNTLRPYFLKNGVSNLDAALVTHLHTDHFLGILQLNDIFDIENILIPNMYKTADNGGNSDDYSHLNNLHSLSLGDEINISHNVYIKSIWPINQNSAYISSDDANENNMVYLVYYNGIKIMVTGDLVSDDEKKMIEFYKDSNTLDCDILKVGHHGSKTSSSEEFLDAVSPEIAIISVGANNMYGHPNQETLYKLAARGIKTYRTDLNGAIGIDIRKSEVKVDTMR